MRSGLFAIEMVWLILVARGFYQKYLGFLMRSNPNWSAAALLYLLFMSGMLVFVSYIGFLAGKWLR